MGGEVAGGGGGSKKTFFQRTFFTFGSRSQDSQHSNSPQSIADGGDVNTGRYSQNSLKSASGSPNTATMAGSSGVKDSDVKKLIALGFSREQVVDALYSCNFDLKKAALVLLS